MVLNTPHYGGRQKRSCLISYNILIILKYGLRAQGGRLKGNTADIITDHRDKIMNDHHPFFEEKRPHIYTVGALTEEIRALLEEHFESIWVEAEISNFRSPVSGHYYMALKDEAAQIRAVMFRPQARYLMFTPEDGMKVIARGRIGVYQPRGEYQIILDYMEPLGVGAMALAFEQLKKKLAGQGVFDQRIKKPMPSFPQRIAVITSPTGAAIRDFLKIIHRRFANIAVTVVPVRVQGEGAASEMIEAIEVANRELDPDVIVLTRGGGSMEDLWAFNQEELALAIRASGVPVVSAVGHEVDISISDLAADFSAPTPSAAAELLVAEKGSIVKNLDDIRERLLSSLNVYLYKLKQSLTLLKKRLRDPRKEMANSWIHVGDLGNRLIRVIKLRLSEHRAALCGEARSLINNSPGKSIPSFTQSLTFKRHMLKHMIHKWIKEKYMRLDVVEGKIKDLGPYSVLKRGYSITRKLPDRNAVRSISQVAAGDRVNVLLAEGELDCLVENTLGS
jgi:exodeoxyribonuclease VII large subunit